MPEEGWVEEEDEYEVEGTGVVEEEEGQKEITERGKGKKKEKKGKKGKPPEEGYVITPNLIDPENKTENFHQTSFQLPVNNKRISTATCTGPQIHSSRRRRPKSGSQSSREDTAAAKSRCLDGVRGRGRPWHRHPHLHLHLHLHLHRNPRDCRNHRCRPLRAMTGWTRSGICRCRGQTTD